jgi:hypothetical protein
LAEPPEAKTETVWFQPVSLVREVSLVWEVGAVLTGDTLWVREVSLVWEVGAVLTGDTLWRDPVEENVLLPSCRSRLHQEFTLTPRIEGAKRAAPMLRGLGRC